MSSITAIIITVWLLGIVLGISLGIRIGKPQIIGFLRVDHSDPEDGPYMFLELEQPQKQLKNGKIISLQIRVEDYLPQK